MGTTEEGRGPPAAGHVAEHGDEGAGALSQGRERPARWKGPMWALARLPIPLRDGGPLRWGPLRLNFGSSKTTEKEFLLAKDEGFDRP